LLPRKKQQGYGRGLHSSCWQAAMQIQAERHADHGCHPTLEPSLSGRSRTSWSSSYQVEQYQAQAEAHCMFVDRHDAALPT
jgi:hypothetical protein